MPKKSQELLIENFINVLTPTENKFLSPKNQPQIPFVLDALSRKERHHVILVGRFSTIVNFKFLESIAQHLEDESIAKSLRQAYFFHLDIRRLAASAISVEQLEQSLKALCAEIGPLHKRIILAINHLDPLLTNGSNSNSINGCLGKWIKSLLFDDQWRIVITTDNIANSMTDHIQQFFSITKLNEPSAGDALAILKTFREELETFHQVLIPDETFSYALSMATLYLSSEQSYLDKALQLLDSGAARVSAIEKIEQVNTAGQFKPVLTNTLLANIVSSWTQIPLSHLHHHRFKSTEFNQQMQKQIFGQEEAINLIGSTLQYARIKLQNKSNSPCCFLFAGPPHVGKTETAYAMAEQLFGHKRALLQISLSPINEENLYINLLDAVRQRPYTIILFENIHQAPPSTLDLFLDIFRQYEFRQAIFIGTTTLGAENIVRLSHPQTATENSPATDLMQLVLSEHMHDAVTQTPRLSPQALCKEIMPALQTHFSTPFLSHFTLIPFVSLDETSIDKIIRSKLKTLAKQLDTTLGIELNYAPEVSRFLIQETLWRSETPQTIEKVLEQHVYSPIAHELAAHEDKSKPKRLLLQLNEAGLLLRCEFATANEAAAYEFLE